MSDLRPWLRDEAAIARAERLLSHLEHWHDRAGSVYDLLNPEAQVQPIIDQLETLAEKLDLAEGQIKSKHQQLQTAEREIETMRNLLQRASWDERLQSSGQDDPLLCAIRDALGKEVR
jgi:DNA repair exonuclease SbcCD ATPase subunit